MLNKKQRVMIDVDSLVDTRLGTIKHYWPETMNAETLAAYSERDHNRIWDIFGVPKEEFEYNYSQRDIEVLAASKATLLPFMLKSLLRDNIISAETNPHVAGVELTINFWPYDMNHEETAHFVESIDWLMGSGAVKLNKPVKLSAASFDIRDKSAQDIRSDFECMLISDLVDWLEGSNEATAKAPAPTLTVYYPAIFTDDSEELRRQVAEMKINPFKQARQAMAGYFTAEALDAELFAVPKI